MTALSFSILSDHQKVAECLITTGADINITDNLGQTPFMVACKKGNLQLVKYMSENDADVFLIDHDDKNALDHAELCGQEKVAAYLLSLGVRQNLSDEKHRQEFDSDVATLFDLGGTGLIIAAAEKDIAVVEALVNNDIDVNFQEQDGTAALIAASAHNRVQSMKFLINKKASVNILDYGGNSPLFVASTNGHVEAVKLLLENGANANIKNNEGMTPLIIASHKGFLLIVKFLLKFGADMCEDNEIYSVANENVRSWLKQYYANNTILKYDKDLYSSEELLHKHIVSPEENLNGISVLINQQINLNWKDSQGNSALHIACQNGKLRIVQVLLHNGALVNKRNNNGMTPIALAVSRNNVEIVEYLARNGADVNMKNKKGFTPVMICSCKQNYGLINVLRCYDCALDEKNLKSMTALMIAISLDGCRKRVVLETEETLKTVETLLKAGANVNNVTNTGSTALHIASGNGQALIAQLLIEHGADIEATDVTGNQPIHFATLSGSVETIHVLACIVNMNPKNHKHETPLILSIKQENATMVDILLSYNVDVNLADNDANTPLIIAVKTNQPKVVEWLLKRKANVHSNNFDGLCALSLAIQNGNHDIKQLILKQQSDLITTACVVLGDSGITDDKDEKSRKNEAKHVEYIFKKVEDVIERKFPDFIEGFYPAYDPARIVIEVKENTTEIAKRFFEETIDDLQHKENEIEYIEQNSASCILILPESQEYRVEGASDDLNGNNSCQSDNSTSLHLICSGSVLVGFPKGLAHDIAEDESVKCVDLKVRKFLGKELGTLGCFLNHKEKNELWISTVGHIFLDKNPIKPGIQLHPQDQSTLTDYMREGKGQVCVVSDECHAAMEYCPDYFMDVSALKVIQDNREMLNMIDFTIPLAKKNPIVFEDADHILCDRKIIGKVHKRGITTGVTTGIIVSSGHTWITDTRQMFKKVFVVVVDEESKDNQKKIHPKFADKGDSGSLVVDPSTGFILGMVFAAKDNYRYSLNGHSKTGHAVACLRFNLILAYLEERGIPLQIVSENNYSLPGYLLDRITVDFADTSISDPCESQEERTIKPIPQMKQCTRPLVGGEEDILNVYTPRIEKNMRPTNMQMSMYKDIRYKDIKILKRKSELNRSNREISPIRPKVKKVSPQFLEEHRKFTPLVPNIPDHVDLEDRQMENPRLGSPVLLMSNVDDHLTLPSEIQAGITETEDIFRPDPLVNVSSSRPITKKRLHECHNEEFNKKRKRHKSSEKRTSGTIDGFPQKKSSHM